MRRARVLLATVVLAASALAVTHTSAAEPAVAPGCESLSEAVNTATSNMTTASTTYWTAAGAYTKAVRDLADRRAALRASGELADALAQARASYDALVAAEADGAQIKAARAVLKAHANALNAAVRALNVNDAAEALRTTRTSRTTAAGAVTTAQNALTDCNANPPTSSPTAWITTPFYQETAAGLRNCAIVIHGKNLAPETNHTWYVYNAGSPARLYRFHDLMTDSDGAFSEMITGELNGEANYGYKVTAPGFEQDLGVVRATC